MLMAIFWMCLLLAIACGIATFVFFVMVVSQMFKRDQSTLGIICIVLTFVTGMGPLIAFIYGWTKATEWEIKKIMTRWTVAFVFQFVFIAAAIAMAISSVAKVEPAPFDMDPSNMNLEINLDDTSFGTDPFPDPTTDE